MKKVVIIFFIFLLLGCYKKEEPVIEEKQEIIIKENIYEDKNPVVLGTYNKERKLIDEYTGPWIKKKDIVWLSIFPTKESNLSKENSNIIWDNIWKENLNKNYKFGLEVSYELSNEKIEFTMLKQSDNNFFKYLEIYLYDGYNNTSKWISHLEDKDFKENTVFTSVKVTAGELIDDLKSSIKIKIFTYDTEDDFNSNGNYVGKSYHVILIKKL